MFESPMNLQIKEIKIINKKTDEVQVITNQEDEE